MFQKIDFDALKSIGENPAIVLPYPKSYKEPWKIYNPQNWKDAVYEPSTGLISVSGANPKAEKPTKDVEIQIYPLNLPYDVRGLHPVVTLIGDGSGLKVRTNIQGLRVVPALFEKLWKDRPYDFFRMLEEIEKEYSKVKNVEHKPFLFEKLSLTKNELSVKSQFGEWMQKNIIFH